MGFKNISLLANLCQPKSHIETLHGLSGAVRRKNCHGGFPFDQFSSDVIKFKVSSREYFLMNTGSIVYRQVY